MRESYDIIGNAKVNLFLRCIGTLPNGYHKLYTLMQEVDISDDINVTLDDTKPADIEIICTNRSDIDMKKNLCYKAADRFYANLHNKLTNEGTTKRIKFPHTTITLTKKIPSEAGMGGGSSDAAAVLLALQAHFDEPFTEEELNGIGVNIGADVPFFLYGGSNLCEGVGEVITPIKSMAGISMVVLRPSKGVSTPECYKAYDILPKKEFDEKAYSQMIEDINNSEDMLEAIVKYKDLFTNDLQAPAESYVSQIRDINDLFYECGADFAAMSGSGSAVFGLFKNKERAESALSEMLKDSRTKDCISFVTQTL